MNGKTPVSALQELMAIKGLPPPKYTEEYFGAAFKCTVSATGVTAIGFGSSKKAAKHESAKNALQNLDRKSSCFLQKSSPPTNTLPSKNYVGMLNEYAQKNGVKAPEYELMTMSMAGEFYQKCNFLGKSSIGSAYNKKDAKQSAAMKMFEIVNTSATSLQDYKLLQEKTIAIEDNKDEIIRMYQKLSANSEPKQETKTYAPESYIQICNQDNVEVLEEKLKMYGIRYTAKEIQRGPYIMHIKIDGTDLHFLGCGGNRNEALREALQDVLTVKKSGCSLDTNDLISLS